MSSEKSNFPTGLRPLFVSKSDELIVPTESKIKKLRKEAEAPALKIEAQLKQEEADLLQLLDEKRKAL